jgi:hypothetical protein
LLVEVIVGALAGGFPQDPEIAAEIGQHGEDRSLRTTVDVTLTWDSAYVALKTDAVKCCGSRDAPLRNAGFHGTPRKRNPLFRAIESC